MGGGAGIGFGHHTHVGLFGRLYRRPHTMSANEGGPGATDLEPREETMRVLEQDLRNRGIEPPKYYSGAELVAWVVSAVAISVTICTVVFAIIWENT